MPVPTGLLIVGHGSRRDAANDVLREVVAAVEERSAGLVAVRPAFLEIARPDIERGYAELVAAGCELVVVHPYFLYPGNHTAVDIPDALERARAAHPGSRWLITDPLNVDERIVAVVLDRVAAAMEDR